MIKLHPTDIQLLRFSEGRLSVAESLLTSAHCDMCTGCNEKVRLFTENLASELFDDGTTHVESIQRDYIVMFEQITNCSSASYTRISQLTENNDLIELEGRQFSIPPTLRRIVSRLGEWSHLVGKLWYSQVDIGEGYLAQFIYMEKGGRVPEHTHKGSEMTLVIDGTFVDGIGNYSHGDFISLDQTHVHAPVCEVDEGCLVFSIIDKPLYFTSGWAKLINPLSSLYYQVNSQR